MLPFLGKPNPLSQSTNSPDSIQSRKRSKILIMKQKKYVFFTYAFKKDPDSTPDKRVDEDKIQSLFGDIFAAGEKLEIYMKKGKDEVMLRNDVITMCDDIIVYRLNDDRDVKITLPTGTTTNNIDDYADKTEPSYPFCHLIFHNQPGVQYVAIEKNYAAFSGNLNRITKILATNFNRMLKPYGYTIQFEAIYMQALAWDVVKRRCRENDDYVSQICLTAKRNKEKDTFADFSRNDNINGLIQESEDNEAKEFFMGNKFSKDASEQSIRNSIDTMFHINQFITKKECELKVKLSKSGVLCLNDEVVPMYFLPPMAIERFQLRTTVSTDEHDYELLKWLNDCIRDIKKTEDETTPPAKLD
mgnify:FL=1